MSKVIKQYRAALVMAAATVVLLLYNKSAGISAIDISANNFWEMLTFLPPIFILVGILDVWVPKESMIKLMGKDSGLKGIGIAFALGSAAAGPLYAAFPVASLLLKKGARLAYVLFFLGAWSSTKLPLVLFEITSLGLKFTLIHITVSIAGFLAAAFLLEKIIPESEKSALYEKAESAQ